ncbi:hypothetical protein CEXT_200571 [Caerostris extrusa]|uniref:Uncharacterized protein n=1 Tax=Caerostris extrusa TaxID=172846 RepID=A0AAV4MUG0_CAEEX|nr:hypothetical protein CEXT_200571 [Caerostris extrusa]
MRCAVSVPCFFTVHGRHIHNVIGNPRGFLSFVHKSSPLVPSPPFHRLERSDSDRQQLDTARSAAEGLEVKNAFALFHSTPELWNW